MKFRRKEYSVFVRSYVKKCLHIHLDLLRIVQLFCSSTRDYLVLRFSPVCYFSSIFCITCQSFKSDALSCRSCHVVSCYVVCHAVSVTWCHVTRHVTLKTLSKILSLVCLPYTQSPVVFLSRLYFNPMQLVNYAPINHASKRSNVL